jgi:hypothetical protein
MAEVIAGAAAVADPGAGAAVADTGAPAAEPESINFDFGGGETLEGRFEEATPQEDRFPDWDKANEEKYKEQPEILKSLKDAHFRERAWRETGFKSAKDARTYQSSVNELAESFKRSDGLKGIEAIKAEATEWANLYTGLAQGDLGVAETFFKSNPDAIDKLTPNMLSMWHKSNPDNYNTKLSDLMIRTLNQPDASGMTFFAQMNQLESLVKDNPQAKQFFDAMWQRLQHYQEMAKRTPTEKPPDFEAERRAIDKDKRQVAFQKLDSAASPVVSKAVSQAAKQLTKGRNIPAETMEKIEQEISMAFYKNQTGDTEYQRNLRDVIESGDQDRVLRLLKAKVARSLPGAARTVVGKYLSVAGKPEPRAEAGSGGVQSGPKRMPWTGAKSPVGGPDPNVIDYQAMRNKFGNSKMKEMLEAGEFMAKGQPDITYTW